MAKNNLKEFKISTLNVNGLHDPKKQKDVLCYLREQMSDIYFLQETHIKEESENYFRASWGYNLWVAGADTNKNGVAILFRPTFEYKILEIIKDPNGAFILIDIELLHKRLTLANIYGPSAGDNPAFFENVNRLIDRIGNDIVIQAGDWNCTLNPAIDTVNYINRAARPRTRATILSHMSDHDLVDVFREIYPHKRAYTWRKFNSNKRGRLDYFLVSKDLMGDVKGMHINPGYRSDHSLVTLLLRKKEFKKDRPFWKFNNSLLHDKKYIEVIKNLIIETIRQYAVPVYNLNNIQDIPTNEIMFSIGDQLFLETLLMEIRGKTISYATYKKRSDQEAELTLNSSINDAEKKDNLSDVEIADLERMKTQLEQLRRKKIDGMIVRSRIKWITEGDKPSRYFCNLENRNFTNRSISFLEKHNGEIIDDQTDILKEVQHFYKTLYKEKHVIDVDLEETVGPAPKLTIDDREILKGNISFHEMALVLRHMQNNKSPGPDGFTVEFFKFFFKDIGNFLVRSANEGFDKGKLSITQYQGVITCIPKDGKPKQFLKNWRPISLLNVTYKIISACIASRIKKVLPKIIHHSQKGFMKGRYIGENIRLLYDMLEHTEKANIPGLIVAVDFEKAFDSVSWNFIKRSLKFFNFPDSIIDWFNTLYSYSMSCVTFNGQYSGWFSLERGCRQGDPISPYLYLICAEIMSLMFRNNKNIKGITIKEQETLLSLFADDTTLFLDGSERSFKESIKVLDSFSEMSGLKINNEKTQIVWIGNRKQCGNVFMRDRNFVWDPGTFKILGIVFSTEIKDIVSLNFNDKLDELRRDISKWKRRSLTPLGKITLIRTVFVSKLTYLFLNLPDPPLDFLKEYERILIHFLWGCKISKIKKQTIVKPFKEGGLNMYDINVSLSTLKISWLRRLNVTVDPPLPSRYIYPGLKKLRTYGSEYAKNMLKNTSNLFWKDVIKHYLKLCKTYKPANMSEYLLEPIFYNPNIKRGKKTVFIAEWEQHNIIYVKDIADQQGLFLNFEDFCQKYPNLNGTNFILYQGIANASKQYLRGISFQNTSPNQAKNRDLWSAIMNNNKAIKNIITYNKEPPTAVVKWNTSYQNINWTKSFTLCYYTTKDSTLQWFQTRLIHRILPTNKYLKMCKIKETDLCSFGCGGVETLEHLFWECNIVNLFWKEFVIKLKEKCFHCARLHLNAETILFGCHKNFTSDKPFDFILLCAKFYIYKCKLQDNTLPTLESFLITLENRVRLEEKVDRKDIHRFFPYKSLF